MRHGFDRILPFCLTVGFWLAHGQAVNKSKEYIYLGPRVIAVENFATIITNQPSQIVSPLTLSSMTSRTLNVTWSAPSSDVQGFSLKVGKAPGASDIFSYSGYATSARTQQIPNLPCGSFAAGYTDVYVELQTKFNNQWTTANPQNNTAVILGAPDPGLCGSSELRATLAGPATSGALASAKVVFEWFTGTGAVDYWLDIGTQPGQGNTWAGVVTGTSKEVALIPCQPDATTIWMRLWTRTAAGYQNPIDYQFPAPTSDKCAGEVLSAMNGPSNGSKLTTNAPVFAWSLAPNAAKYWLDVGNSPGQGTYFAGEFTASPTALRTKQVTGLPCLPNIGTLHSRLWTFIGGLGGRRATTTTSRQTISRVKLTPVRR